jgi:hypothetical protein
MILFLFPNKRYLYGFHTNEEINLSVLIFTFPNAVDESFASIDKNHLHFHGV